MVTINQLFDDFIKKISLKDEEFELVKEWIDYLKPNIERLDRVDKIILSGSYKRETAITPLHDVDIYAVMKRNLPQGSYNPSNAKSYFQSKLAEIKPEGTQVFPHEDHGIKMNKGNFHIDFVITRYLGTNPDTYEIISKDNWIRTSPIFHEEHLRQKNQATNGMAQNFIKLMKYWNKTKKKPLNSYHLEMLVLDKLPNTINSYPDGMKVLLEKLSDAVMHRIPHPLIGAPYVDELTNEERELASKKLKDSFYQARVDKWEFVFDQSFLG